VNINIQGSTIAALNLGTVVGDLQPTVNALQQAGQPDVAEALKQLAETVAEAQGIGERERRDAIELIAAVGEEASKGEPRRSRLEALGAGLWNIVKVAGEAGAAYHALRIALRAATGVELP
jgi:hypothetical protein